MLLALCRSRRTHPLPPSCGRGADCYFEVRLRRNGLHAVSNSVHPWQFPSHPCRVFLWCTGTSDHLPSGSGSTAPSPLRFSPPPFDTRYCSSSTAASDEACLNTVSRLRRSSQTGVRHTRQANSMPLQLDFKTILFLQHDPHGSSCSIHVDITSFPNKLLVGVGVEFGLSKAELEIPTEPFRWP